MARNHFGRRDDGTNEMSRETLDDWTAERLMCGALPPDDAPPGYGGVATLLAAARTEARTVTSIRAEDTIAAMVAGRVQAIAVVPRRRMKAKVATAASAGLLAMSGMTAAGALPSVAQQQVSTVLAKVGISVPKGDGGHGRPRSGAHAPSAGNDQGGTGATTNHGDCVSAVAGSGGAQVSPVARSDCGKPSTAGAAPTDATHGTVPPGQVKPDDKTHPTHPPQSSSGGSNGNGSNGTNGTNGTGHDQGKTPPTKPANSSPPQAHESNPPAKSSPPPHQNGAPTGHGQ